MCLAEVKLRSRRVGGQVPDAVSCLNNCPLSRPKRPEAAVSLSTNPGPSVQSGSTPTFRINKPSGGRPGMGRTAFGLLLSAGSLLPQSCRREHDLQ